jgi:hypothetical protein
MIVRAHAWHSVNRCGTKVAALYDSDQLEGGGAGPAARSLKKKENIKTTFTALSLD